MMKINRIELCPLRNEHSLVLFDWINDREQVLFNSAYKPVHQLHHEEWFKEIQNRNDVVIFGIHIKKSKKLIGTCQLYNINTIHHSAELSIRLGDVKSRNKGYGSEAVNLLLDFAFKDLNLHRVFLHVLSNNERAIKTYEKNGFIREGTLRAAFFIDGQYLDAFIMGILREEYINR